MFDFPEDSLTWAAIITVIYAVSVVAVKTIVKIKRNHVAADKALVNLTEKVFAYLEIDPNANPLYATLFMNDYVRFLTINYSRRSFRKNLLGNYGFQRMSEAELEDTVEKTRIAYVSFDLDRTKDERMEQIYKSMTRISWSATSSFHNYQIRAKAPTILKEMFRADDKRILVQKSEINKNIRKKVHMDADVKDDLRPSTWIV